MMGRQRADQAQFFYSFHLEERIPASHLLRKINVFVSKALADVHREMAAFYSEVISATFLGSKPLLATFMNSSVKFMSMISMFQLGDLIGRCRRLGRAMLCRF